MSKHTKTPWKAYNNVGENMRSYSQSSGVIGIENNIKRLICGCFNDIGGDEVAAANAAHIVRCVNAHDALVSALKDAQRLCKKALPKFNWGASALDADAVKLLNEVPAKINAALALARGEK